jgi:universal stress protein A
MKLKTKSINRSAASARGETRVARSRKNRVAPPADPKREEDVEVSTILVPVDFSPGSLKALSLAMSMARRFGASIILLHALDTNYSSRHFDSLRLLPLRAQAFADAEQRLARLARQRGQTLVPIIHRVGLGVVCSVIIESAAETQADLIVMGSEGRTGVSRFLVGSVAEKVVRHAPCPVLVVRDKAQ